jgi:hypothetical protein
VSTLRDWEDITPLAGCTESIPGLIELIVSIFVDQAKSFDITFFGVDSGLNAYNLLSVVDLYLYFGIVFAAVGCLTPWRGDAVVKDELDRTEVEHVSVRFVLYRCDSPIRVDIE